MQRIKNVSILALLGASLAVGCNVTTEGNEGNVSFTPDECGRVGGCDFADGIGVGGVLSVNISGLEGFSTVGIDLESSDPEVLQVEPTGDINGEPTWNLIGLGAGTSRLMALDADRVVADYIDVEIIQPDRLMLVPVGEAVGPTLDNPDYDEVWQINNNQRVVFHATPVQGIDTPIMGRYEYVHDLDEAMEEMVDAQDLLASGQLDFTPTADGEYTVFFGDNFGNGVLALIVVAATP